MTSPQPTPAPAVRVLVVDDQRLIRDGITTLLAIQPGIELVGTAANGQEAVEQARALSPDLVLMDVRMPVMDGVAATVAVRQQVPSCQVLMLSTFDDDPYVIRALLAGASGYLLKDIAAATLAQAIQLAHAGLSQLDVALAGRLVQATERLGTETQPANHADRSLSGRELDVLRLVATGASNRDIAGQLGISEGTVKNHVSHILSQLRLHDRTQAAIYAHDNGLV